MVQQSPHFANDEFPKILIGIPVKNCAAHLDQCVKQLINQDWPGDRLRVVLVENDSADDSSDACLRAAGNLRHDGIACDFDRLTFGFHLPHESRHLDEMQSRRLWVLKQIRQHIVDSHLGDADYLYWVDADFELIPPQTLRLLASANKDIIIPVYRKTGTREIYDGSSCRTDSSGREMLVSEILKDDCADPIVRMTRVNAAAMIHRRVFEQLPGIYLTMDGDQEGATLSKNAVASGFSCWLHKKVVVYHAFLESTTPLVQVQTDIRSKSIKNADDTLHVLNKIQILSAVKDLRVLYLLYTHHSNHESLCRAQLHTWGNRTERILFYSNQMHPELPTLNIPHEGEESYENMWRKVIAMVAHACKNYISEYDWFFFGGNDLFVIPENLKHLLLQPDIAEIDRKGKPLYLGRRLELPEDGTLFNSGGAGYVLNRQAMLTVYENLSLSEPDKATAAEDVMMAKTLQLSGVHPFDTRDDYGAERFHPLTPEQSLNYPVFKKGHWFSEYTQGMERIAGLDGISRHSISFHYLDDNLMYFLSSGLYSRTMTHAV